MKAHYRKSLFVISTIIALSACDSASSDAKKVDVANNTPAAAVDKANDATPPDTRLAKADTEAPASGGSTQYQEGKHYVEIFPEMQTDAAPGKVEVVEMIWLGCPHCYSLEPTMNRYKKNHPDFIEFKQVPAMLNPSWAKDGDTYYIADFLDPKGEKKLITKVFQAIHEQKRRLNRPDAAKRFFIEQGFTAEQIDNVKNSMAYKAKIKRAQEISAASQAQSVPTIIINGKYRTSPYMAGSEKNLMEVIDMLTKKEHNK